MDAAEAVQHFCVKLCTQLPLDNALFLAMVKEANLLPLDTGDSIRALPTRAEKVDYFLRKNIEPAAEQNLPKLLNVMKNSGVSDLKELADEIQAKLSDGGIEPGMFCKYACIVFYI